MNTKIISIADNEDNKEERERDVLEENRGIRFDNSDSLWKMNTTIKEYISNTDIIYWGDIGLEFDDLKILIDRISVFIEKESNLESLFKQYAYAMISYVVLLAKTEYKGDFWGIVCDKIGAKKLSGQEQMKIGQMILNVFDYCELDYSTVKKSSRKYVDAVLYEIGEPPESNLGDLFYIFKYGFMGNADPQMLIDEIICREYIVHKGD